jgi:hypothetical protein
VRFTEYYYGNKLNEGEMGKACSTHGRGEKCILIGKPEERRPVGRPRHRWEDNIRMDLREMGGEVWTGFVWFRIGTSGGLLWTQ